MNAYYEIAKRYFDQMEGRHLYPGFRHPLLWTWSLLSVAWITSLVWAIASLSFFDFRLVVVVVLELALLIVTNKITDRKHAQLLGIPYGKINRTQLEALKLQFLCENLKARSENFLDIVKEIRDLTTLRKEFRQASELEIDFFLRKLYDPDSKPRVLAIFLAAVALFTALTVKNTEPQEVFEMLSSEAVWQALYKLVFIAAMFFAVFIGAQALAAVLWTALAKWSERTFNLKSNDTALRYLIQDMVHFYQPKRLSVYPKQLTDKEPNRFTKKRPTL